MHLATYGPTAEKANQQAGSLSRRLFGLLANIFNIGACASCTVYIAVY